MAFDLVQYFAEQIKIQKPQLLNQYSPDERRTYLLEINALTLGKLVSLWKQNENVVYQEIQRLDHLYVQEVARHLTTSPHNRSRLNKTELEQVIIELLEFQLKEIKQLDETGSFGQRGLRELILGQVEHLAGHADDWVWLTNDLKELKGSKTIEQEQISLDETMKEFNLMVNMQKEHTQAEPLALEPTAQLNPTWAKIFEPIVALVVLWILFEALQKVFA
ncbi:MULTISPECIES: hypothetical protein [unclassified Acinetobacter]|uniref:hypothetical protein n=1 Tax=unclassified Acinetobacter TaxID=196816 RepID=UPI0025760F21|nr:MULTISPECIES: hypothetical protein [unclassified Acinetobacter]MDM1249100.1 hypothetical protein [Acinetobacter sp. R933-2]MDM1765601.1 hypothetical protein [Acinetobacter sp. 226-1]MDM1769162.1 hypothetical protein [Acinetobacter sp. 226-4]